MPPTWLTIISWVSLAVGFLCAGLILRDIYGHGYRQKMTVMEAVWPVTALYLGPLAWWGYRRWGRVNSPEYQRLPGLGPEYDEPVSAAIAVSHCGAGCTLGDLVGEWLVFTLGWEVPGVALAGDYIADLSLAFAVGIAFQYFSIAPMRGLGVKDGIIAALKADTLSLVSFEVGLFGWMALMQLVFFARPHLYPDHAAYWLLMQVGMSIGFAAAYPTNLWLIRRGIKAAM